MMTDRELLQQALDMLDDINQCSLPPTGIPLPAEIDHVMEALRARLTQPNDFNPDWDAMAVMVEQQQRMAKRIEELTQLVTSQGIRLMDAETQLEKEWVGLTDEEIWKDDGIMAANSGYGANFETLRELARAIEAKLKEKNT